jgi:hypothetical protein
MVIILNWILRRQGGGCELDSSRSGQRPVAGLAKTVMSYWVPQKAEDFSD